MPEVLSTLVIFAFGMFVGMLIMVFTFAILNNKVYTQQEMNETITFYEQERLRERGKAE